MAGQHVWLDIPKRLCRVESWKSGVVLSAGALLRI